VLLKIKDEKEPELQRNEEKIDKIDEP